MDFVNQLVVIAERIGVEPDTLFAWAVQFGAVYLVLHCVAFGLVVYVTFQIADTVYMFWRKKKAK
ncbi:MAG: hypothetical protein J6A62_08575 [Oscillospiraceae bacterium]|nr:hypothetical protein [Oscillospiraceae bacterium]